MKIPVDRTCALIVVDVQRDFCPGGALAVKGGDEVVPILNRSIRIFLAAKAPIYATRDWHPKGHISFKARGGPWPPHCVRDSLGASFHPGLELPVTAEVISKGSKLDQDAYSGFEGTDLVLRLWSRGVRKLFVGGLATDYCVRATVLDGLHQGFRVFHLSDASRGVNLKPGDSALAVEAMKRAGAWDVSVRALGPLAAEPPVSLPPCRPSAWASD